jgi:hypothetical protein
LFLREGKLLRGLTFDHKHEMEIAMPVQTSAFWRKPEFIRRADANGDFSPPITYDEVLIELARINAGSPPITSICPLSHSCRKITDIEINKLGLYYFRITSSRGIENTAVWVLPPA